MENKNKFKREIAKKFPLKHLLTGTYVLQEGWNPNYVESKYGKISRINTIGVIVKIESPTKFLLDDGTATIGVNCFSEEIQKNNLIVGDSVLIIARIREYENSLCLVTEILNKNQINLNKKWFEFRKQYLDEFEDFIDKNMDFFVEENPTQYIETPEVIEFQIPSLNDSDEKEITPDNVISFIRKHDSTNGCAIQQIIDFYGQEVEKTINLLISMGEVYEIKAGFLKIL
jgi:hypothetical protein